MLGTSAFRSPQIVAAHAAEDANQGGNQGRRRPCRKGQGQGRCQAGSRNLSAGKRYRYRPRRIHGEAGRDIQLSDKVLDAVISRAGKQWEAMEEDAVVDF